MECGKMAFNLDDYTTVQERSNIFWERYKNGAIRTKIISESDSRVIMVCELFRDSADEKPFATGHAKEVISDRGVNRDFALENCETSARGVAFKTANIGTEKNGPSREEMARVVKTQTNYSAPGSRARAVENVLRASFAEDKKEPTVWSVGDAVEAIPLLPKAQECKHGAMILKEGIAKTGKSYYGYVCSAAKPDQCEARWAKLTAAGSWFFPSDSEGGE
jgi:hypothetical protein